MESGRFAAARRSHVGRDLLVIAVLSAPLIWLGLAGRHFWPGDEAFDAEIAREMATTGDYVVPRLDGEAFLEKPPLHYAAVAVAYSLLGVTPMAARLPSAVAGLLTLGLTYFLGRRLYGRETGTRAALLLPTMFLFFYATHSGLIDSTLVLFVTGAYLAATYAHGVDARRWATPAVYASATLAFLAKGFVGPILIGLGLAAHAVVGRFGSRPEEPPARRFAVHALGLAALGGVIGAWAFGLARSGGIPFLREALLANSIGRIVAIPSLTPVHDSLSSHDLPPWSLAFNLLGNVAPWTPMFLALLLPGIRAEIRELPGTAPLGPSPGWRNTYLPTIVIVGLVALSVVHQKRGIYLLPLYPLIAVLLAAESGALVASGRSAAGRRRWLLGVQLAVTSLLLLVTAASPLLVHRVVPENHVRSADVRAAVALEIAVVLAIACSFRMWRRGDARQFWVIWGQVAASLLLLLAYLVPRLDSGRSCDSFLTEARVLTEAAGATPVLAVKNEGVVGLAALHFGRVLPLAIGAAPLRRRLDETSELYVIAEDPRVAEIALEGGRQSEVQLQSVAGGRMTDCPVPLFLVRLRRSSRAGDAPRAPSCAVAGGRS